MLVTKQDNSKSIINEKEIYVIACTIGTDNAWHSYD